MFSIFKKKKAEEKFYTSEEIHAEIIAQNLIVLESIKQQLEKIDLPEKIKKERNLLISLGLINSRNMRLIVDAENKINLHNKQIEINNTTIKIIKEVQIAFENKAIYLPKNVFISLLDKYNLYVGGLSDYTGTIPDINLKEIFNASAIISSLSKRGSHLSFECPTLSRSLESWHRIVSIRPDVYDSKYTRFPMIQSFLESHGISVNPEPHYILIAAPFNEINTYIEVKEKILTNDPIVFSTVGTGVIVYSMWGDEGNDEVFKKYQELCKFITDINV